MPVMKPWAVNMPDLLKIEQAISEYLETHPRYFPPEASQHPAVVALTEEVYPVLVDKFGGVADFWEAMLAGAKGWFEPSNPTMEFRYFCTMIENDGALMDSTEYMKKFASVYRDYRIWARKPST